MEWKEKREKALQASQYVQKGKEYEAAGELSQAEEEFKQAAMLHSELSDKTGEKDFRAAAREDYERLADIHMQQGNMHGADHFYVLSMDCRRRMQEK